MPRPPLVLPVAEYAPDLPPLAGGGSVIKNAIPRTKDSYGPLSNITPYSGALSARCQGGQAFLDSSGNIRVFAGDASKLYQLTASATTFANVSRSGGYTVGSDQNWKFALMAQRVMASQIGDPIQSYLMGTSSLFSDLAAGNISALTLVAGSGYTNGTYALSVTGAGSGSGFAGTVTVSGGTLSSSSITNPGRNYPSTATIAVPAGAGGGTLGTITPTIQSIAPKTRYMAIVRNFLVCGWTNDASGGDQPQRVWWSSLNDPTNWPTPGTAAAAIVQSNYNDLFGDGGWIQGVVGNLGTADGAVFMEREVWRMVYAGPPGVFYFYAAEGSRGTPAPNSIVQLGPVVFYLGRDGFYAFDGTTSKPIGVNKIDKDFYSRVDQNNLARVVGAVDPINKLIIWAWPDTTATNGNPNHLLIYHWQLDKWTSADLTLEYLLISGTFGQTIDSWDATYGTLDAVPNFPFDSRVWTGGKDILAAFDTSHMLNYFNGAALQATIDFSELQPIPGQRLMVTNARPLVDGGVPQVSIGTRNRLVDATSYNAATSMNALGTCPQRANGRYLTGRTIIPAGSAWSHCQGLELEGAPSGVR